MDVHTDLFLFDQMRDQLDWIQQANSNYNKTTLLALDHTPQYKVLKKIVKNPWFEAKIKTCWDS